jgi:hypothetical protein
VEAYIILGFLFGLPLLIGSLFRINTAYLYVSILSAELLTRYFTDDAELVLAPFVTSEVLLSYIGIVMLSIPLLLTGFFLHGSLSHGKTLLHLVPLLLCGVVFAAFAVDVLPDVVRAELADNPIGSVLMDSTQFIVGVTVLLQLVALWLFNRSKKKDDKKKR